MSTDHTFLPRRMTRRRDGALVAGVAAGVAEHLRVPVLHVRVVLAALTVLHGFGVVVYGALWIFVPRDDAAVVEETVPPGLAAAGRKGRRPGRHMPSGGDLGQLVAFAALTAGLAWLAAGTTFGVTGLGVWPLVVAMIGLALIWRQADEQAADPEGPTGRPGLRRMTLVTAARVVLGLGLVTVGVVTFLAAQGQLARTLDGLLGTAVVVGGLGLILWPWLWRTWRSLAAERRQRIVEQERADVAAHLHDSVLQTLALIQRQADDPRAVVALARGQERDLRHWLYVGNDGHSNSLAGGLAALVAEAEDAHGVPVELVTVGNLDRPVDDRFAALLASVREAVVNAAKHSGADHVDVYAEAVDGGVEVFVRDRGSGFTLEDVPEDRMGIRGSILGRMERHGGTSSIRSDPGDGTEVRFSMAGAS